ncbi:MAG TPA: T9SS type A sorting domain-containing protein [Candidatus Acidoferrales bacterium]|nr:T9SS type A sorting domain-containing protein [Candidatus Acidoferrales bacterium]
MLRKIYSLWFIGLMGTILMTSAVRSQTVEADFSLSAVLNAGYVNLSWEQLSNFTATYYRVYRAAYDPRLMTFAAPHFTPIDSTTGTSYTDTLPPMIAIYPPIPIAYVYLVKAFNLSGDSEESNMAAVYLYSNFNKDKVTITSTPPLYATVDSVYSYKVTAVSDSPAAVLHYRLGEHPELMVIDSTGLITWIPQVSGYRDVEVIVTSSLGGEARQDFVVRVAMIDAQIAGNVSDTLGQPLSHVVVHLYRSAIPLTMIGGFMPLPWDFFDYRAETDSAGNYSINHVDGGKYFVRAIPLDQNYLPEWYNNVQDLKDATPIGVTKDSTYSANFTLKGRFYRLPKFTVSGSVTDTSGNIMKGALVVFARAGFVFNEAKEDLNEWINDENFRDFFEDAIHDKGINHRFDLDDVHSPYVFRTHTDSNGVYNDTLPQGHYVAFAWAKGYFRTFYNDKQNLLTADILNLLSDTTGINFNLIPVPPVVLGQISGSVLDSTSGTGVAARMIAFRDVWNYRDTLKMHVAGAYFTDADTTGTYTFADLPPGYYKILALPLGSYALSFYSLSGPTVRWKEATAVQIDGNAVGGINIYVMPIPDSASGYASISGTITTSTMHTGVSGAIVYSADANGNIMGYGITDGNGNYTITGLSQGAFNVFTDVVGYNSTSSSASSTTYNSDGTTSSTMANLSVDPESPLVVKNPTVQPTTYSLEQNYPNPFNPTTQIAFSIAQTERVSITIYNILGQKIVTILDGEMSPGPHVVTWDGRNLHGEVLPSGVYFYRLSTSSFSAVKKMVLLK